jgi:hypothetical protein
MLGTSSTPKVNFFSPLPFQGAGHLLVSASLLLVAPLPCAGADQVRINHKSYGQPGAYDC